MKIKDVVATLERFAPLPLQDGFDNAGLQIGQTEAEVSGVLLCLDVTEAVIEEASSLGANLVVAHHPLLFHALKHITGASAPERCAELAIRKGIGIYASHTNMDNVRGGVNYKIVEKLGGTVTAFLQKHDETSGSGVLAELPAPVTAADFLAAVKREFNVKCLMHNDYRGMISRIGVCGGAGSFLLDDAISAGAQAFLTGEMHYHDYFGHDNEILIAVAGHYQTEQFTTEIFRDLIHADYPELPVSITKIDTNPIKYL